MKKLVLLPFTIVLLTTPVLAYKQADLDKLRATNKFARCDLTGADLSNANLRKAELHEADLSEANLPGVDLSEAILNKASLYKANLYRANLKKADLKRANLFNALLRGAASDSADLMDAKFCNTILPSGNPTFKDC